MTRYNQLAKLSLGNPSSVIHYQKLITFWGKFRSNISGTLLKNNSSKFTPTKRQLDCNNVCEMIVFLSDEKCPKTKLPEFFWQFMRSKCHKFISENLCARNMWIFECGSALSNRQNNTNIQTLSHDEHRLVTCTFERQHGPSPKKTHLGGHAFLVVTFITFKCDFVSRSVLFTWI